MIGAKVIEKMNTLNRELLAAHATRMAQAFLRQEDGKLAVSISFTLAPNKEILDTIDVDASISYIMERVKEKITSRVSEKQDDLPGLHYKITEE
jgi:hypothetical protein